MKKKNSSREIRPRAVDGRSGISQGKKTKIKKIKKALLVLFSAALFCLSLCAKASEGKIYFSEVMYDPDGSDTKKEWFEIFNGTGSDMDLGGWKFFESNVNHSLSAYKGDFVLEKGEYAVIAENAEFFMSEYPDFSGTLLDSSFSLSNSGEILQIKDKSSAVVAEVLYSNTEGANDNGFSLEVEDGKWRQSYQKGGTPGKENSQKPVLKDEDKTFRLNEILPNPSGEEEKDEFIEIYNFGEKKLNLKGWSLKDASASGKYDFEKDLFIEPKGFAVVYRSDFSFALNNSGDESVLLITPLGETVSQVDFSGADEDVSYNFDGKNWRWSKDLTPGKENIFNNPPEYSFDIPDESYKNVYTYFEVKANDADGDNLKATWDFGDGHKSYLMKTKHKYLENGKYFGSLKISDGSEDVLEEFEIEIDYFPHPKVKIVSISPNPVGKDSELETITIQNKSKKKINLFGWSVATGWKSLVNHPIKEDFEIKPGKTKVLTREESAFSLNNKKLKIELRYPDGEVADKVKYKNEESVEEGVVYEKKKGKKWEWIQQPSAVSPKPTENEGDSISQKSSVIENTIKTEDAGKKSEIEVEDVFEKAEKDFDEVKFPENDLSKPLVLGANALWIDENRFYRFIYESTEGEHYVVAFAKGAYLSFNGKINTLLNEYIN